MTSAHATVGQVVTLRTDRLELRPWREDEADLARLRDIRSRPEVAGWLADRRPVTEPAAILAMVRRWATLSEETSGRYGVWAVQPRGTDTVVGGVVLKPLPGLDNATYTADIEAGWFLHPDSWGRGYATEAARALLDREFAAGAPEIYAVVYPGNTASAAVATRLGMRPLGLRSDRWYGGTPLEAFVRTNGGRGSAGRLASA
ncbi:GNAT family N-acetyltransferase [Catenuloplanes japonicus]|uniref:GNAT family N-acetyltransferase n=1 Tax=Catenuloplanes japonicus TaxID=33876 RepID=UPI00068A2E45|nr:GNAT family N-acetyltransferase [Catenuloplanes japonicus]